MWICLPRCVKKPNLIETTSAYSMCAVKLRKEIMSCGDAKHLKSLPVAVVALTGWRNQKQQHSIEYLREGNRVLREQLGTRRLRFPEDQRRRLAAKAKLVGRRLLNDIA